MIDDHDRLPLTRSLETEVLSAFAVPTRSDGLKTEALIAALEALQSNDVTLTQALADAGFMQANAENQAVLDWIQSVFDHWEIAYPTSPELQRLLHQTRSLAAAFALNDSRFFIPGGHALHRLLDRAHHGLTGWHKNLGDAGSAAFESTRDALERARRNFPSEPQVDEALDLLNQKFDTHRAQLERFDATLLERESATLDDSVGRVTVALALNDILASHAVPGSVARFIKSDWYESGVLIISRYGDGSSEWRTFISTTQLLVDAVQQVKPDDVQGQERLQNTMQQLPGTLSRQLLSLHPDTDATAGAIGLIEYALLRNMRGEDLGLLEAEPIAVAGLPANGPPSDEELADAGILAGNWYAIDSADGEQHLRLAGTLVANTQLLFMDFLGARALRKSTTEFISLLYSGEARNLDNADSFCRAMVEATENKERERQAILARQAEAEAEQLRQQEYAQRELTEQLLGERAPDEHGFDEHSMPEKQSTAGAAATRNAGHLADTSDHAGHDYPLQTAQSSRRDDAVPSASAPYESNTVVKLQIPMGTWIGFHDRDPPLMARAAVRDLEKDSYIFTNREGIKLRELTVAQLMALIDRDMVDVLDRKSNFRETISQMRSERERLSTLQISKP